MSDRSAASTQNRPVPKAPSKLQRRFPIGAWLRRHLHRAIGPEAPSDGGNWIRTDPAKGWFGVFLFYGPLKAYIDKTWKLDDVAGV